MFDYFASHRENGCFRVLVEDFVTSSDGSGVVHCAPGFGADDFDSCARRKIIDVGNPPCPVDDSGHLTDPVTDYKGIFFKDADPIIIKDLQARSRLLYHGTCKHSYPHCWRTDTPLMYRTFKSWFIKVSDENIKSSLIANNKKAKWVPSYVQEGRFHNWLSDVKDWCISRNRLWGNPIPIWMSEDGEEIRVIGSIAELEKLSGRKITDLHRDFIDDIVIPSEKGKGNLK